VSYLARFALAILTVAALPAAAQEKREFRVQIGAPPNSAEALYIVTRSAIDHPSVLKAFEENRIRVDKHVDPRGTFWRVMVGPFETKEAADRFCNDLRAAKQDCMVR
jgi:cell division septation protein DedD